MNWTVAPSRPPARPSPEVSGAAADRLGRHIPGNGDARGLRTRRQHLHRRPDHRAGTAHPGPADPGDRVPAAPRASVPAPAGHRAVRPGPAVLGGGPRLRHRVPRPRAGAAGARRGPAARRAGGPAARPPAGSAASTVGALPHLGAGRRPAGDLHQGAPRGHRRRVRQRDPGRAAGPVARRAGPAAGARLGVRPGARPGRAAGPQPGLADQPPGAGRPAVRRAAAVAADAGDQPDPAAAAGGRPAAAARRRRHRPPCARRARRSTGRSPRTGGGRSAPCRWTT
jgi:hypothetical protein